MRIFLNEQPVGITGSNETARGLFNYPCGAGLAGCSPHENVPSIIAGDSTLKNAIGRRMAWRQLVDMNEAAKCRQSAVNEIFWNE